MIESTLALRETQPGSTLSLVNNAAGPAVPVAVNVVFAKPATTAVIALEPAEVPRIQLLTFARPLASVVAVDPVADPLPADMTKFTVTFGTPRPSMSFTTTAGPTGT